jgi:ATP-dependent exoDNAse (exonuclease V) beta subunit
LRDGTVVEGVIDLAFREHNLDFAGWTVVDFKTDREFTSSSDRYVAQVRAYTQAVEAAMALPARGVILVL